MPGHLEVTTFDGVRVVLHPTWGRALADPSLFPPLHDVQLVKASKDCMKIRGGEKPKRGQLFFQEWVIDFHKTATAPSKKSDSMHGTAI